LQEEEAARANRHGYTRHEPALPLYTVEDAAATLRLLTPRPMGRAFPVTDGVEVTLRPAGHILGSATVDVAAEGPRGPRRLCFSGDLGRWGRPILKDPAAVPRADVVLCEATYGDRVHPADVDGELARIVIEAAHRGGALLVPAFAVGRTQELLWRLRQLEDDGRVPALPVYLDSPTAIDVTALYLRHAEEHDPDMAELVRSQQCGLCPRNFRAARTPQESKALNDLRGPVIIISASGMATGGRILYHLRLRLPERRTTVLLAGFQAAGTRGRALQDRATQLRIHGQDVPVKASVVTLDGMSAHADRVELLRWLSGFTAPPKALYLVHAEPHAARAFAATARKRLKWPVRIAKDREVVTIAG
jgi:metallo-beta-lactamase family protein